MYCELREVPNLELRKVLANYDLERAFEWLPSRGQDLLGPFGVLIKNILEN